MLHEVHEDTHEKCNVAWKLARGMPCCQSLVQISMAIDFGGTVLSKAHVEMNETAFDFGCTVLRGSYVIYFKHQFRGVPCCS